MGFIVIIPARFASTRLPAKPLADLGGKPMIVRVVEQARRSDAMRVIVATDDERIAAVTRAEKIETLMTSADNPTGTDRLAEAVALLDLPDHTVVVNVQGDEPFIPPGLINRVAEDLQVHEDAAMATACHPLTDRAEWENPNVVKVVLDRWGYALYFSRAPIPFPRDAAFLKSGADDFETAFDTIMPYRHYGLYAYRSSFLRLFPTLAAAPIENIEKLEQLRALWHGYKISAIVTDKAPAGIDTEEDLVRARKEWKGE
jgi:3-deoxy-manno-octulosonate cytidylyltransferase (CMP-KDO synthetase)